MVNRNGPTVHKLPKINQHDPTDNLTPFRGGSHEAHLLRERFGVSGRGVSAAACRQRKVPAGCANRLTHGRRVQPNAPFDQQRKELFQIFDNVWHVDPDLPSFDHYQRRARV
jgi:hypothetical protein